jgi:hypothetical protein
MLLKWIFYGSLAAAKVITVTLQDDQPSTASTTLKTCSCTDQGKSSSSSSSQSSTTDSSSRYSSKEITTKTVTVSTCSKEGMEKPSASTLSSLCFTCQQKSQETTSSSSVSKEQSTSTNVPSPPQFNGSTDTTGRSCTCPKSMKSQTSTESMNQSQTSGKDNEICDCDQGFRFPIKYNSSNFSVFIIPFIDINVHQQIALHIDIYRNNH